MREGEPLCKSQLHGFGRAVAFLLVVLVVPSLSPSLVSAALDSATTGVLSDLHSDKRVVQTGRWMVVREFTVDFAVRGANETYCGELTTQIATDVDDLTANKGQVVEIVGRGKDLELTLKNGKKIKAHMLAANKCPRG